MHCGKNFKIKLQNIFFSFFLHFLAISCENGVFGSKKEGVHYIRQYCGAGADGAATFC
jgi:hypothetical protein